MTALKRSQQVNEDIVCCYRALAGGGMRVMWEITSHCNMRCMHCFATPVAEDDLSFDEIRSAIDGMADAGVRKLAITGGEPLMRHDLVEILHHVTSREMLPKLLTNGILIDAETARRLSEVRGLELSVSIDGAHSRTHDTIRRNKRAHSRLLRGLDNLRKYPQLQVNATCVVTALNYLEIPQIIELARSYSMRSINFSALLDVVGAELPRVGEYRTMCRLTPEHADFIRASVRAARENYDDIAIRTIRLTSEATDACPAGRSVVYVDPAGGVHPCSLVRIAGVPSLRQVPFATAIADSRFGEASAEMRCVCS